MLLDVHSRSVLGFTVSFDAPSAAGVALAIAQGVLAKSAWLAERGLTLAWPMHGAPRILHLDNDQEFHAHAFKRGCQQHGIRIDYRPLLRHALVAILRVNSTGRRNNLRRELR